MVFLMMYHHKLTRCMMLIMVLSIKFSLDILKFIIFFMRFFIPFSSFNLVWSMNEMSIMKIFTIPAMFLLLTRTGIALFITEMFPSSLIFLNFFLFFFLKISLQTHGTFTTAIKFFSNRFLQSLLFVLFSLLSRFLF